MTKLAGFPRITPLCALAAVASCVLTSACATSPEVHYYTLSAEGPTVGRQNPAVARLAIGALSLPHLLDQPKMIRRTGPNQIDYAEYDRWAVSLSDLVRQTLAQDLTNALGSDVLATTRAAGGPPLQILQLDIERFEADSSGAVSLKGTWTISTRDDVETKAAPLTGHGDITAPGHGASATAIAQTMSEALAAFSQRIALQVSTARQ